MTADIHDHEPLPPTITDAPVSCDGWGDPDDAPENTWVIVKTRFGRILKAQWTWGYESDEGSCGGWSVDDGDPHPDCWSDGVCWTSNADDEPSDPVVGWMSIPAESGAQVSERGDDGKEARDEPPLSCDAQSAGGGEA